MNGINVDAMETSVFGQIAEQVVGNRGGYDDTTREQVIKRVVREGETIGRTAVIRAVYDGEIGDISICTVSRSQPINILSQGI